MVGSLNVASTAATLETEFGLFLIDFGVHLGTFAS